MLELGFASRAWDVVSLSLRCVSSTRNIHRSLGKITRLCQTLLHGNKFDDIDTLKIRTSPQIFNLQTRDSERGVYIVYAPACHVPASVHVFALTIQHSFCSVALSCSSACLTILCSLSDVFSSAALFSQEELSSDMQLCRSESHLKKGLAHPSTELHFLTVVSVQRATSL